MGEIVSSFEMGVTEGLNIELGDVKETCNTLKSSNRKLSFVLVIILLSLVIGVVYSITDKQKRLKQEE